MPQRTGPYPEVQLTALSNLMGLTELHLMAGSAEAEITLRYKILIPWQIPLLFS